MNLSNSPMQTPHVQEFLFAGIALTSVLSDFRYRLFQKNWYYLHQGSLQDIEKLKEKLPFSKALSSAPNSNKSLPFQKLLNLQ